MSFFAVLLALLIEQIKPLPRVNRVGQALQAWVAWVARTLDAGQRRHARIVWAVSVLVPTAVAALLYLLVRQYSLLLALAFDVAVLYLTLGFRQFSHYFTDIRDAIDRGDEAQARQHLAQWKQIDASDLPRAELLRQVLEHALLAAHRHVFGVFFWFVILSALGLGPAGAVLYRLAEFVSRRWLAMRERQDTELNDPARAVGPLVRRDRPGALAPDGGRIRRGRQLRGGGERLAARGARRRTAQRRRDPGDRCGRGGRADWPVGHPRAGQRCGGGWPVGAGKRAAGASASAASGWASAEHGGSGVALGGVVDAAGGLADAGQRAGLTS